MTIRERVEVMRRARAELARQKLSASEIEERQAACLASLLRQAVASSRFHRERIGADAIAAGDLRAIPTMDKADLVEHFDQIVADRRLTRDLLARHLESMRGGDPMLFGEFRLLSTSGTSGTPGFVPFDRSSWLTVLAAAFSSASTFDFKPRLFPRRRLASITATGPLHMTNRVFVSNRSPAFASLRLDVTSPTADLARDLNRFRPDFLSGYPSVLLALVEEQRTGNLSIDPKLVFSTAEQLTPAIREAIAATWCQPVDVYSTTETGGMLAQECPAREGLHLREDHCIVEAVDAAGDPVPDGSPATAMLVTSWLNRTLPLIRYRIEDPVLITSEPCRCGRAGRRILQLSGRQEDAIILPARGGDTVAIHPNLFEEAIEARPEIARYQVVHRAEEIAIFVVAPGGGGDWSRELGTTLTVQLRDRGAEPPPVRIELVAELERPRTIGAKLKVVRSEV